MSEVTKSNEDQVNEDLKKQEDLYEQAEKMLISQEGLTGDLLKALVTRREEIAKEAASWLVKKTSTSRFTSRMANQKYWQCLNGLRDVNREIKSLLNGSGNGLGGILTRGF